MMVHEGEIRPVPGMDTYLISMDGSAFRLKSGGRIIPLKSKVSQFGYKQICVYINGKSKFTFIHRMVALAFVHNPNPDKFKIVDHIDNDKLNCNHLNLQWCDHLHNNRKCIAQGRGNKGKPMLGRSRWDSPTSALVEQWCPEEGLVGAYPSTIDAAEKTGSDAGAITLVCNGHKRTHHGFLWRYAFLPKRQLNNPRK